MNTIAVKLPQQFFSRQISTHYLKLLLHSLNQKQCTTGSYMAKLDKIGYRVCSSGFSDVYETIQNPEFQNPAIGGI